VCECVCVCVCVCVTRLNSTCPEKGSSAYVPSPRARVERRLRAALTSRWCAMTLVRSASWAGVWSVNKMGLAPGWGSRGVGGPGGAVALRAAASAHFWVATTKAWGLRFHLSGQGPRRSGGLVNINELRLGFSNTTRNPEGMLGKQ
jgi:hypothetical protein